MKVPVSSPQNNHNPKPVSNNARNIGFNTNNNTTTAAPANLCYEPTSVLDLRRSPSPVLSGKPVSATDPSLEWDEHVLQNFDWDSIMKELDFHEDSAPTLKNFPQVSSCDSIIHNQNGLHEFTAPPNLDPVQFLHSDFNDICFNIPTQTALNSGNWNIGFDLIQELIRAADCIDSNEIQLAHVILDRLNHRLHSPVGKPLQRAAFFFKEALQSLLTGSPRPQQTRLASWSEVVQNIRLYKTFSGISPIPMFTHFTSNQALLETLDGSPPFIHIIDFDIGLGCQYASLMRELVERADVCAKFTSPVLRITAIVTEDYAIETQLIKQCLSQYALELKIRFQIEFVLVRTFEMVSFKSIKLMDGEKTTALLSPAFFRRLGSSSSLTAFVSDLRRVSPGAVVVVDSEGWMESGATSFRRNFVNSLEFFSMIFESLDAATGGGDWGRKIEMCLLKPKIFSAVEGCGRRVAPSWKEAFCGAGLRPIPFSQFAEFQADCLLGKVQVRGFYVAKRQSELVLCWHERPLIATSVWKV